jgi:acyl-CoA synthetase (AMP-forming)/AMP-acid ligase II
MRLGALWVGINRVLAPREKVHILNDSGAALLLAPPDVHEEVSGTGSDLPALRTRVTVDPGAPRDEWVVRLARQDDARPDVPLDPWGPAAIAYTSGTTGKPKGAVHSQHNILLPGAVTAVQKIYPAGAAQGAVLPLTILNIFVLGPVAAWQYGVATVAMDRIDAVGVADWIEREQICTFSAVPTVIHDLLTHPEVRVEQLASMAQPLIGGAECPEEFRELYRARFGADVAIGYGMTEAPTAVTRAEGEPQPRPGCAARRCRSARSRSAAKTAASCPPAARARSVSDPRAAVPGRACIRRCSATGTVPTPPPKRSRAACITPATSACASPTARCSSAGVATS